MKKEQLFLLLIGWAAALLLVAGITISRFPYQPTFPYAFEVLPDYGSRILTTWAQFDGVHYLTIITKGYEGTGLIQAFFPLYPLAIRFFSFGHINPVWIGIMLSISSFGVGLWWLYKLIRLDESEVVARRALWLLIFAPTAFFFMAVYTEGLFFMLLVGCFYLARKGKWWWASLLGILLTSTKIVGIFIIPALFYEYWYQQHQRNWKKALSTVAPALGVASYMFYLKQTFGDPLLFYHVQESFGAQREVKRIILLFQVFYRYIKMFLTIPINQHLFYVVSQEFMAGLVGVICLLVGWFSTRRSYVIFGILAYLTPTLTGTLSSMPRYLLPIFPIYIVAAKLLPKWAYVITLVTSIILLVVNVIMFTQGLWVA